jgi:hypothetical protein
MATKSGKSKEVAKHPHMGSREESFGGAPGSIPVEGGTMHMFGHKINKGVWPTNVVSTDVKTGFPQGFDKGTKGPKA